MSVSHDSCSTIIYYMNRNASIIHNFSKLRNRTDTAPIPSSIVRAEKWLLSHSMNFALNFALYHFLHNCRFDSCLAIFLKMQRSQRPTCTCVGKCRLMSPRSRRHLPCGLVESMRSPIWTPTTPQRWCWVVSGRYPTQGCVDSNRVASPSYRIPAPGTHCWVLYSPTLFAFKLHQRNILPTRSSECSHDELFHVFIVVDTAQWYRWTSKRSNWATEFHKISSTGWLLHRNGPLCIVRVSLSTIYVREYRPSLIVQCGRSGFSQWYYNANSSPWRLWRIQSTHG